MAGTGRGKMLPLRCVQMVKGTERAPEPENDLIMEGKEMSFGAMMIVGVLMAHLVYGLVVALVYGAF
jgi:hypothetical protein